jgi:hypothetical protein
MTLVTDVSEDLSACISAVLVMEEDLDIEDGVASSSETSLTIYISIRRHVSG